MVIPGIERPRGHLEPQGQEQVHLDNPGICSPEFLRNEIRGYTYPTKEQELKVYPERPDNSKALKTIEGSDILKGIKGSPWEVSDPPNKEVPGPFGVCTWTVDT